MGSCQGMMVEVGPQVLFTSSYHVLFIFLGNLTSNHISRNFKFSPKLHSLIFYYWKNISPVSRAMTLSQRTVYFPCCSRDFWFVFAQAEVSWQQEKKSLSFTMFSFCFLRLDSKSYQSIWIQSLPSGGGFLSSICDMGSSFLRLHNQLSAKYSLCYFLVGGNLLKISVKDLMLL